MLKLLSINIQGDFHIERVLAALRRERPDVLCLQEIFKRDIPIFERELGGASAFAPMGIVPSKITISNTDEVSGVGIFSACPLMNVQSLYYAKHNDELILCEDDFTSPYNRVLLSADIIQNDENYTFATTHFTWTPHGVPDENQKRDLPVLLEKLATLGDFVLCGDMNAPRGMATFETIAKKYTDHIPKEYITSLDPLLHRTKGTRQLMVDALFSTPEYQASDVRLEFGVSDHAAIVATIDKK